ncbi:peptidase [Tenacibaculum maritimum]|uniref:peptidase n=1 Tax=Tenacibaculum maritimum TaxID=107401 RepID=UPI0012E6D56D|nr:peptidase [Tenacibaculum maritimum]MCD9582494.1 peptidase [Tenacibaculum maritimum]MCD9636606.1 peptidase [Tenacibaculum maritimum]CAA0195198.1 Metal-dependent hydrolases of the beta-lactamase superfamily III protein [Tenacibaculum maritimum]CAA0238156.1 Metal-dependent hydrolases of the beta-lactamase superfamily III protein [Tenacibaculum maritimum]CAA0238820.1 Metal-dependent hydrolases of the beta-lactamase superfamily III protein [Tenacibaculum maritimum]
MFNVEIKSSRKEDICILIKVANHSFNYICDCGEAKELTVKECQDTSAIFISHTHIDHFINFGTILRHQIGTGKKVVVCGPKGIINQVQSNIKSYCWNLIEKGAISYEVREIQEGNMIRKVTLNPPFWEQEEEESYKSLQVFEEKDFVVEFEILNHKTAVVSYLFKAKDKVKVSLPEGMSGGQWVGDLKRAYEMNKPMKPIEVGGKTYLSKELFFMIAVEKGKRVGVIMDHAASIENHQKIKSKYLGCDEVYIECFYKDEDKAFAEKNYHSYASMSGKIMSECKVEKAIPVHFSRKYNDADIVELIAQFEKAMRS